MVKPETTTKGALCFAFVASICAGSAASQPYPARPVRMVVPWPAGGSADILGRVLGQKLGENLAQTFVIDNRPGAGSTLGTAIVAKSAPDGYTVLLAVAAHAINATMYRKLPYDTVKDFEPVVLAATVMPVLVVHPAVPASTVREFIELAKSKPGTVTYASAGNGSTQHLAGELFKSAAGIGLVHVPYKGGPPAVTDLIAKQVSAYFPNIPTVLPHIKAGRLKAIAVTGARRSALLPTVPSVAESGIPGFEVTDWYGMLVSARTRRDVVSKLNSEVNGILRAPEMQSHLIELGFEVAGGTPEQFAEHIRLEITKWAKAVNSSGAKID